MTKKMLIDATHEEETRVAVVDGNRLSDFDYESAFRKQLKGSIFLAKVTRVEPSLQAAFVNFGGNRHGFLPFSEIHPDYLRIPISDREALIAEQEAEMEARRAAEEAEDLAYEDNDAEDEDDSDAEEADLDEDDDASEDGDDEGESAEDDNKGNKKRGRGGRGRGGRGRGGRNKGADSRKVEIVGGDGIEGDQPQRPIMRKNYKIQEVVKRGQIMLIQVSKEERGNKGAAVGTYLSLPGRYCVLMPNSPRAGGVSRKIANFKERKRMREILKELQVPQGMSVIMRTAGVSRTKAEIKRDLDYLMKLWDGIRSTTLESTAPALIHEEGSLVRRAIRDIYTRDIDEIIVSGEDGYKKARDVIKMMIPSHAKKVQQYKDDKFPLFQRYQIESQISEIGDPVVTLPSGGYLVINPTEALVSVDVNSGRATKERHIEETALRTNLEAAEEVARQLRLRDLGGLVVVDFIDMENRRNNRKVENKIRDALSTDRARIQIGRISTFGLMELSRQRMNPSLTEAQFEKCSHCQGVGVVRSVDATAI
ncbi:MAG: Rne/Rng family ribonuclease, partial [Pseudomonadota bacterium]|nr:Rne/Rng family ribonuclease [Pseudomonadota bacterium]